MCNIVFGFLPHYHLGMKWPVSNLLRRFSCKLMFVKSGLKIDIGRKIKMSSRISVDDYSSIGDYSYVQGKVEIGKNCMIAPKVAFIGSNHIFSRKDVPMNKQGEKSIGIKIKDDVWIGYGAMILDGVTIESGAIIGAGSIVTKNVGKNEIVAGSPAKMIKRR